MAESSPKPFGDSKSSPISSSRSSSSPYVRAKGATKNSMVPEVEIGAPCLRCTVKCEGLLLHVWRKICINCGCPRNAHQHTDKLHSSLQNLSLDEHKKELRETYAWYPDGLDIGMVKHYMSCLPNEYVPLRGSDGERVRAKLYLNQLPLHDTNPASCHKLSDLEKKRLLKFAERRKNKSSGVGNVAMLEQEERKTCSYCSEAINLGNLYITSPRSKENQTWHPPCFRCAKCSQLLVDLIHFYNEEDKRVYCGRHFAELKHPRCFGCDELIMADSFTRAEGRCWHKEHFCCEMCDDPLQGKTYGQSRNNGKVLCQRCFTKQADTCKRCLLAISLGETEITENELHFHKECFTCKRCREPLADRKFFHSEQDVVCEECMQPAAQCSACKEGILPSIPFLKFESRSWHKECFYCVVCKTSLVGESFHNYDGNVMCQECYKEKVSKKCLSCLKSITGTGIQYNYQWYHPECFRCSSCNKILSGEKVLEKQGQPLCLECTTKSAKRCHACKGLITSRHTIYEGKTYHLNCFKCTKCGSSIGNRAFYKTSLRDVLCESCANGD